MPCVVIPVLVRSHQLFCCWIITEFIYSPAPMTMLLCRQILYKSRQSWIIGKNIEELASMTMACSYMCMEANSFNLYVLIQLGMK